MDFNPPDLNLPSYPFKLKREGGSIFIFDDLRKKFLVLTPEEWVRQHIVQFLIIDKRFPKSLIKLEGGLKLHSLQKRTDIVVYDHSGQSLAIVECKAPHIKITQEVFDQVARYNMVHQAEWLIVSNGLHHYCCRINFQLNSYTFVPEIPSFADL
jgi:hypothetical protein